MMQKEKWPLDTMAVLTCEPCGHQWSANWKKAKAIQDERLSACPQCNHQGELSEEQHTTLAAHLDNVEKVTSRGSTRVMWAGLAAFLIGIGSFLGLVPIGVVIVVMIPAVWMMFSSSSEAKKLTPIRFALSSPKSEKKADFHH
ncbi:hypothetical protein [Halomonas sp. Mc5H-6]|uniref:hypothetical protein n=1 Tax=Halomonas sp. Mc5H-6 TaxID=2954500 RepID=UPI0020979699|nr:hypothetical protein [Halomonas sp. Mc5H-6]